MEKKKRRHTMHKHIRKHRTKYWLVTFGFVAILFLINFNLFNFQQGSDEEDIGRKIVALSPNYSEYYGGYAVSSLTGILPKITIERTKGETPYVIHVSAKDTTCTGCNHPYDELEYTWNFGDSTGNVILKNPVTNKNVNANEDQYGPEAAYYYETPGNYTINLTVRGWTGTQYIQESTTQTVQALPWNGETRYFDPQNGDDTNDGLATGTPWKSWDKLLVWVRGGDYRQTLIKRGTTMILNASLYMEKNYSRIMAYGNLTEKKPIIKAKNNFSGAMIEIWGNGPDFENYVIKDIILDAREGNSRPLGAYVKDVTLHSPYGASHIYDLAFINLDFLGNNSGGITFTGASPYQHRYSFWNCKFSSGTSAGQGLFISSLDYMAIIGGEFSGGNGNAILDHHIYPSGVTHALYRWIDFKQSILKNFCINTNCHKGEGELDEHILISDIDCTGTRNGIDMSNSANNLNGTFDKVILQRSKIYNAGSVGGSQAMGIYGHSFKRYTIRDNLFYNNSHGHIRLESKLGKLQIYRNKFFSGERGGMIFSIETNQSGRFTDNTLVNLEPGESLLRINFSTKNNWLIERNQYYAPNTTLPFRDLNTGIYMNFTSWQAAGLDLNGKWQDPKWQDPKNGNFNVITSSNPQCSDGVDNDNDGLIDWQYDLGCWGENDTSEGGPVGMRIENGWTTIQPSNDTRIIYVSDSDGNDSNDGLSPTAAVKTIAQGYYLICEHGTNQNDNVCRRDNTSDWLLLKRGDTFSGESGRGVGPINNWLRSGKNDKELVWMATYGNSTKRPVIINPRLVPWNDHSFVGFKGLELYMESKDPNSQNFSASGGACIQRTSSPGNIWVVEDNLLRYCGVSISGNPGGAGLRNITFRRNVITHSYSPGSGHSQGSFFGGRSKGITLIENVYDMNGWIDEFDTYLRPNLSATWSSVTDGRFSVWVNGSIASFDNIDLSSVSDLQGLATVLQSEFNNKLGNNIVDITAHKGVIKFVGNFGTHPKIIDIKNFERRLISRINWARTAIDRTNSNSAYDLRLQPSSSTISDWKASPNVELSIRINGTDYIPKGIDFSSANNMSEVATIIQNAINNEYNNITGISNALSVKWNSTGYSNPEFVLDYVASPWVQVNIHSSLSSVTFYPTDTHTEISETKYLDGINGYEPDATQFNHNIYIPSESVVINSSNGGVRLEGNILSRGSASSVQVRPGGDVINNLMIKNVGGHYGRTSGTPVPGGVKGTFVNNVVMHATFTSGTDLRGGSGFEFSHINNVVAENNIFAHSEVGGQAISSGGAHEGIKNLTIRNNIVYDHYTPMSMCCELGKFNSSSKTVHVYNNTFQVNKVGTSNNKGRAVVLKHQPDAWQYVPHLEFYNNKWWSVNGQSPLYNIGGYSSSMSYAEWISYVNETGSNYKQVVFEDPTRNITTYHASLGKTADYDAFINEAIKQSRFNWRTEYTADAVNDYIRAGFKIKPYNGYPVFSELHPKINSGHKTNSVRFKVRATDVQGINNCTLYINNVTNQTIPGSTGYDIHRFTVMNMPVGTYTYKISCINNGGNLTESTENRFYILKYNNYNTTQNTNLSDVNLQNTNNLIFDITNHGRIQYIDNVDLRGGYDIDTNVKIKNNYVKVNTTAIPNLNRQARITLRNLGFTNIMIQKNGLNCTESNGCYIESYTGGVAIFNVTSFSTYTIIEGGNSVCGNNIIEGVEVCDGTKINSETCVTQGWDSGTLTCKTDCLAYNTNSCSNDEGESSGGGGGGGSGGGSGIPIPPKQNNDDESDENKKLFEDKKEEKENNKENLGSESNEGNEEKAKGTFDIITTGIIIFAIISIIIIALIIIQIIRNKRINETINEITNNQT